MQVRWAMAVDATWRLTFGFRHGNAHVCGS
jgi:hypothetical protein